MGNMRTMAFQVPEELFQKIKDYLQRNNMTQKQFVIGLIENEIERDLAQRQAVNETPTESEGIREGRAGQCKIAAVSDCVSAHEEVGEQPKEQDDTAVSDDFEAEDVDEDEEPDEAQDESEGMTMSM